jgi:hypothetical protein
MFIIYKTFKGFSLLYAHLVYVCFSVYVVDFNNQSADTQHSTRTTKYRTVLKSTTYTLRHVTVNVRIIRKTF